MVDSDAVRISLNQLTPGYSIVGGSVPLENKRVYTEAHAEGYQDEVCGKCGRYFPANVHFIRCQEDTCPMKDGKPSILDRILGSGE